MANTGNWLDGQRSPENATEDSIRQWINSLGITFSSQTGAGQNRETNRFTDVSNPSEYFYNAVYWAVRNNVTTGTSTTTFTPSRSINRAEFVTFLWRLAGKPQADRNSTFTDTTNLNADFRQAIAWADENGVVTGIDAATFAPRQKVSRAMAATILYRYYKGSEDGTKSAFKDVDAGKWYTAAINWGGQNGIIQGVGGDRFNGNGDLTRGQAVTLLYRAENK